MVEGPPTLDGNGYYLGPLPRRQGCPLIGRHGNQFATSASAAWPSGLCQWAAEVIITSYLRYRETGESNNNNCNKRALVVGPTSK